MENENLREKCPFPNEYEYSSLTGSRYDLFTCTNGRETKLKHCMENASSFSVAVVASNF